MKLLQIRLEQWAVYYKKTIHGLGYPDQTTEYKLMKYGVGASHTKQPSARILEYMPHPRASETDQAINDMPESWQKVIKMRYLESLNQKAAANLLDMKERKYAYILRDAHTFLAAKLNIRLS